MNDDQWWAARLWVFSLLFYVTFLLGVEIWLGSDVPNIPLITGAIVLPLFAPLYYLRLRGNLGTP